MSETIVLALNNGVPAEPLLELPNSHGSAPVIWNDIAMRYLGAEDFTYWTRTKEIWPLYKHISAAHQAVLLMTYDYAVVLQKDYVQAAEDIRTYLKDFPVQAERVNHWESIAELFESQPDCQGIGFWMTTVGENPFAGTWNEQSQEYDGPIDWTKCWDVYSRASTSVPPSA